MELTVLVDNNTIINQYYFAEPAVSYWIEESNKKILQEVEANVEKKSVS